MTEIYENSANIKIHGETMNDAFPLRLGKLKISTPTFSIQHYTIDFMRNIMGKRSILEWKMLISVYWRMT